MTILFDVDIIAAVERGDIAITDFDDRIGGPLGTNSYDLRLGHFFFEVVWDSDGPWYVGPMIAEEDQRVEVPVAGTLLAMTKERVTTKGRVTGIMKSRSSTGREGLTVCKCAGLGDVGYDNHWTMELTGLVSRGQPFVVVGERIAQIAFFEGRSKPRSPYSGQYRIEDWPLCMIPKRWRHRIIEPQKHQDIRPFYKGGKVA